MHAASRQLLHHVIGRSAAPALRHGDSAVTWKELDDASRALAASLAAQGAAPGDRVAVCADNSVAVVVAALANHRAGFVHVPVNPGYGAEERAHVVGDSGARLVLDAAALAAGPAAALAAGPETRDGAPDGAAGLPADGDVALLIYTSGTTGKSKGCTLSFANVVGAVDALATLWEITSDDEVVHALPLFHVHGLCVALHGALIKGARTRLLPKFSPSAVVDAVARGGTVFMGVPTMYRRLLDHLDAHPDDGAVLAKARLFTSGSAPLPAADLEDFERKTGHRIVERYGMSETLITLSNPVRGERKAGTVGKPVPGVSMRVVDGELQIRGPGVMRGYWRNDDAPRAALADGGWLKTGDLVTVDADGYVTVAGRISTDILKVGGYKISTREIEEKLQTLAGVRECAVVGVPDREWGQRVVACVVLDPPLGGLPPPELLARIQGHVTLQSAKVPRGVLVVDALPRNAMGKVQKRLLERAAVDAGV